MKTYQIELLNPKALKLLKNLADLKLIKLSAGKTDEVNIDSEEGLKNWLSQMKNQADKYDISEDDISQAVAESRRELYGKPKS